MSTFNVYVSLKYVFDTVPNSFEKIRVFIKIVECFFFVLPELIYICRLPHIHFILTCTPQEEMCVSDLEITMAT